MVFDFDGVLVESVDVKTRAFAALYSGYGPRVVAKVAAYHLEHGGISRFEKFRYFHREFLGRQLTEAEEARLGAQFSELVEDAVVNAHWIGGAREFLETWHGRLPLFVASGTPDEELKRIVERRGMTGYFAGARGSPATKAEIISGFVAGHGLDRHRVLMVGDAGSDLHGALAAGVSFLGISAAANPAFPATVPVLPDLARLADFLNTPALQ